MSSSWEEEKEQRAKRRMSRAQRRLQFAKGAQQESKKLQEAMRKYVKECGLTPTQVADFSGCDPSTVYRLLRRYQKTARIDKAIALLRVAGYRIEVVKIDPHDDEFRQYRMYPLPPLEDDVSENPDSNE